MAKLAEALRDAVIIAKDDSAFESGLPGAMSKVKRGLSEVRKKPELLADVSASTEAWSFILRTASEKPAFAKQAWELSIVLLESKAWANAFAPLEAKHRIGVTKAGSRDAQLASDIVLRLVAAGAAEVSDVLPPDSVGGLDPALCSAVLEGAGSRLGAGAAEAFLASDCGRALADRAGATPEEKRKVLGVCDKKTYSKEEGIPVFACEGISGSLQKVEISKVS